MNIKDCFLVACVILAWGINFIIIKLGVQDIPPLMLAGLRFALVAFPAIFIIPRPHVALRWIIAYGMTLCFGQFAFLFMSLKFGMPAGLASLLLQAQAFFTLLLSVAFLGEKLRWNHILGLIVAFTGVAILARNSLGDTQHAGIPLLALGLIILAALCWGLGNISNRIIMREGKVPTMSLVTWSGLIPILPLFACSWIFEGSDAITQSFYQFHLVDLGYIAYLSLISTILGYGIWGYLLGKYETWRIAPLSLLVPVVGIFAAWVFLDESMTPSEIIGAIIIASGLVINVFGHRILQRLYAPKPTRGAH